MIKNAQKYLSLAICLIVLLACGIPTAEITPPASSAAQPEATQSEAIQPTEDSSTTEEPPVTDLPPANSPDEVPTPAPVAFTGLLARQHLIALTETIGARTPGSPEEAQAAQYIQDIFQEIGYATQLQPFSFTSEEGEALDSANVIAVKPGLSSQEILVGAHYDSTDDGTGVDDNASGVAVMLEVAESIAAVETPYTIRFIAFGAEENNMNGSRFYVDQMSSAEIRNTVDMINLDSLVAGDIAYVYGDAGSADSLRDWIMTSAQASDFDLEAKTAQELDNPDGTPCDCADYGPFQEAGISFAYFEATNWNLGDEDGMTQVDPNFGQDGEIRHTEYDTMENLEAIFPGRIDHHLALFANLLYAALTQFD